MTGTVKVTKVTVTTEVTVTVQMTKVTVTEKVTNLTGMVKVTEMSILYWMKQIAEVIVPSKLLKQSHRKLLQTVTMLCRKVYILRQTVAMMLVVL